MHKSFLIVLHPLGLLLCLLVFAAPALFARNNPMQPLFLSSNGAFRLDGVSFNIVHFTPGFKDRILQNRGKASNGFPKIGEANWRTQSILSYSDSKEGITLRENIRKDGSDAFTIFYEVHTPDTLPTQEVSLQITIPVAIAAGREIQAGDTLLPISRKQPDSPQLLTPQKITRLLLPSEAGVILLEGDFEALIQDQRRWRQNNIAVRIRLNPETANPQNAHLKISLRHQPASFEPIALESLANRGFSDPVASDLQGGWTDQGPDNDLSSMQGGELRAAGVDFRVIVPEANNGRSALVLGSPSEHKLPQSLTLPVDDPASLGWHSLYLLHAGAWLPKPDTDIGTLRITYGDNSIREFPIRNARDIANWWTPTAAENAAVGWTGATRRSEVGLYVSRFPLEGKPVKSITFERMDTGSTQWMITALSASAQDVAPYQHSVPFEVKPDKNWQPYAHTLAIEPGSVFDFSSLLDAPAGKHGHIQVTAQGNFAFADKPTKPVRFWGVNLTDSANFLSKEEADKLAERIAASGYNSVRFHHFDRELILLQPDGSIRLNPEKLDQIDYLFHALKERGIYMNIDLFSRRSFNAAEMEAMGMEPDENDRSQFKTLYPISDKVFDVWAEYAEKLLTHVNPYTSLSWAEDPALIGICPINEDGLAYRLEVDNIPSVRRRYQTLFETWWQDPSNRAKTHGERDRGFNLFIHETQIAADAKIRTFLRDLGATAPLTGSNFASNQGLAHVRANYDYIDNHRYADHPRFPRQFWRLPFSFHQNSATAGFAGPPPRELMPSRQFDKPFAVTEFHFVMPNRFRSEGSLLMPAYASLQDWDALYNFEYAQIREVAANADARGPFALASDPIGLLADRIGAVIFLRGDVEPARNRVGYAAGYDESLQTLNKEFPEVFSRLGLITRIGSVVLTEADPSAPQAAADADIVAWVGHDAPAAVNTPHYTADKDLLNRLMADGIIPQGSVNAQQTHFRSDTGQIELDAKAPAATLRTARTEQFVLPARATATGAFASVQNGETFASLTITSVDHQPLTDSQRLLILHLTDSLPQGMQFANQDRRLVEQWGTLPHLVHAGTAEVELKLDPAKRWQAWAVGANGKRLRALPLRFENGIAHLSLNTVTPEGTSLAYEVSAE